MMQKNKMDNTISLFLPFGIRFDLIIVLSDLIAIFIAILGVFLSWKAVQIARQTTFTQNELQGYQMISETKRTYLLMPENHSDSLYAKKVIAIIEDLNNAYDVFCAQYLANKLDKKNFLITYYHEIAQWVEANPKIYDSSTKFKQTCNVYHALLYSTEPYAYIVNGKGTLFTIPADHVEDLDKRYKKALQKLNQK